MLGFSGRAIDKLHVPGLLQSAAEPSARGFWYRWSRTVQRHPLVAGVAALLVLVCLALPALLHEARLHRRRERSAQRHDPTGLRRPGHRVRTRVQRTPDHRGQGPRRTDHAAVEHLADRPQEHARGGLREPGPIQPIGPGGTDLRHPDHLSPGGADRGAGPHTPRSGDSRGHRRHRGPGLRRRGDGRLGGRIVVSVVPPSAGHRGRAAALVPPADGRVPIAGHPAEGGRSSICCRWAPPTG